MSKAVFLDRDGTIIRDMTYLNDPLQIEVFQESYEAIKALNAKGYIVILVTNQSGVARGIVQMENLLKINALIIEDFRKKGAVITEAYFCPHPVDGGCQCRKPNAGMLQTAAQKHNIDLKKSWMVGDRMTDVEAGRRAGCRSILLQNETTPPIDPAWVPAEFITLNMLTASQLVIEHSS